MVIGVKARFVIIYLVKDENRVEYMIKAIKKGDIEEVKRFLRRGINVNMGFGHFGVTPLMTACYEGYDDIVSLLLEHGADVNKTADYTDSFFVSWSYEYTALAQWGVVTLEVCAVAGYTPLMVAVERGYGGIIKILLDNGAKRYLTNRWGEIASEIAKNNQTDIPSLLKDAATKGA
jgi:ankyrin repeat protein